MSRLVVTLASFVLVLVAIDQLVSILLSSEGASFSWQRQQSYGRAAASHFDDVQRDARARISGFQSEWELLPAEKPPGQVRIFIIGNSSALFAIQPGPLRRKLSELLPGRDVVLMPWFIEGLRIGDEPALVRAALEKQPDMIVLTPNPKSLTGGRSTHLRGFFGVPSADGRMSEVLDGIRAFLRRHWTLYRERFALQRWVEQRVMKDDEGLASVQHAFDDIAEAAQESGLGGVLEAYGRHGLRSFSRARVLTRKLPTNSAVFLDVRRLAKEVGESSARGVAIFMPLNPLFRIPDPAHPDPPPLMDDAYARWLAKRVLRVFSTHRVKTFDELDAVPATGFVDLIHMNDAGAEAFTKRVAELLILPLRMQLLVEGSHGPGEKKRRPGLRRKKGARARRLGAPGRRRPIGQGAPSDSIEGSKRRTPRP